MEVEIDIPNQDHLLKPGMFMNVAIIVDEHANAITLPTQALLKDDSGYYVFNVDGKTCHRVNVKAGVEQNNRTEIVGGLTGAENIVTLGQQFVKDNGQVTIQQ
jgi:multidrug efflux pump subunit AcrA (membrane-fusion protein)